MKCDKLKAEQWLDYSGEPMPCYPKAKVDETIAELKQKLHDAEMQADLSECAVTEYKIDCDKLNDENRRLKRALWLDRAERAKAMKAIDNLDNYLSLHKNSKLFGIYATRIDTWYYKWDNVERKCLKKAEEYK